MTKEPQTSKSTKETPSIPVFDPTVMFQTFMSKFTDTATAGENPAAVWLAMNQHWMNFLGERFKKDAALLERLSKCTKPKDLSAAQSEFYKEAVQDYRLEFAEMAELGEQAMIQLGHIAQENAEKTVSKKA
ncbi:MAG: phasin family protein [Pseudomonadota bacterium]